MQPAHLSKSNLFSHRPWGDLTSNWFNHFLVDQRKLALMLLRRGCGSFIACTIGRNAKLHDYTIFTRLQNI